MYKISDEVIKFIEKTRENWRVELTAGGKGLVEVKIQRRIFQGDALSPLLFVITMMPFNQILRECPGGCKLSKSQEKSITSCKWTISNCLPKNEKEFETLIQAVRI